ncbi:hypothetical protein D6U68_18875, partial [Vibrio cholerae]|nr:hypothetical protein [Vibrio cholerae]
MSAFVRCSPLNAALYLLEILVKIKNVFAILLIVYLIPIAVWYFVMVVVNDYALSTLNSDWGAFGSFVGGVLSPIFSLVSVLFVIKSINENNTNNNIEIELIKKQDRRNYLISLIAIFNNNMLSNIDSYLNAFDRPIQIADNKFHMFTDESVKVSLMKYMSIKDSINVNNKLIFDMINNFTANCEISFSIILKYVNS